LNGIQNQSANLRKCLFDTMTAENIPDVDFAKGLQNSLGVDFSLGNKGVALNMFIDKVVPLILKDAIQQAKALGTPAERDDILKNLLSYGKIVEYLKDFMYGAQGALDLDAVMEKLRKEQPDKSDAELLRQIGEKELAEYSKFAKENQQAVKFGGMVVHFLNQYTNDVAFKNAKSHVVFKQFERMFDSFVKDSLFEKYVNAFLVTKFMRLGEDVQLKQTSAMDKAQEYYDTKLRPGFEMVLGSVGSDIDPSKRHGAEGLFDSLKEPVIEMCNKYKGGQELYGALFNCTFKNILNRKLENAIEMHTGMDLVDSKITKVKTLMENTARTYGIFNQFFRKKLVFQILDGHDILLDKQVKKGNISEEQADSLHARLLDGLNKACDAALERFFEESPLDENDPENPDYPIEMGINMITEFFEQEQIAAVNEAKTALTVEMLATATNDTTIRNLTNSEQHVIDFLNKNEKLGNEMVRATGMSKTQLMNSLQLFYNHLLNQKLSGIRINNTISTSYLRDWFSTEVDRDFANKFLADFPGKATAFLTKMKEKNDVFDAELLKDVKEDAQIWFDEKLSKKYADIPSDRKNVFIDKMAKALYVECKTRFQTLRNTILSQPGKDFGRATIYDMIQNKLGNSTVNGKVSAYTLSRRIHLGWVAITHTHLTQKQNGEQRNFVDEMSKIVRLDLWDGYPMGGDPLNNVLSDEMYEIVNQHVKSSFELRKNYDFAFGFMSRTEFDDDFLKEVSEKSKGSLDKLVSFKKDFLKETEGTRKNYSALTLKVVEDEFRQNVMEYVRSGNFPTVQEAAGKFTARLKEVAQQRLDELSKKANFALDTSKLLNEIRDKYKSVLQGWLKGEFAMMSGLSDEDRINLSSEYIGHMTDRYMEKVQENLDEWLKPNDGGKGIEYTDVEKEIKRLEGKVNEYEKKAQQFEAKKEKLKTEAEEAAFKTFEMLRGFLAGYDADLPSGRMEMLKMSKYKSYLDNKDVAKEMDGMVKKWLGTETGQAAYKDLQKSFFQLQAYAGLEYYTKKANELFDSFFAKMDYPLEGVLLRHLETKVQEELPKAIETFGKILDSYKLPKTEILSRGGTKTTLREMAEAHFKQHVADYQKELAKKGVPGGEQIVLEPLLSFNYLASLTKYLRENYLVVMLEDTVSAEEVNNRLTTAFIDNPQYAEVFDPKNGKTEDEKKVILNNQLLVKAYGQRMIRKVKDDILSSTMSLEDFASIEDVVKTSLQGIEDDAKTKVLESCKSRIGYVKELEKYSSQSRVFVQEYLEKKLGTGKFNKLHGNMDGKAGKLFYVETGGFIFGESYEMSFQDLVQGLAKYLQPHLVAYKDDQMRGVLVTGNMENGMYNFEKKYFLDTESDKINHTLFNDQSIRFLDMLLSKKINDKDVVVLQLLFNKIKGTKI